MKQETLNALTQELLFIKTAEVLPQEEPYRSQFKREMWLQFLKNVGAGAAGYGVGRGLGELGSMGIRKLMQRPISEPRLGLLSKGVGVLGGLSSMAAMNAFSEAQRRIEDARQKDEERRRLAEQADMVPKSTVQDVYERE